MERDLGLSQSGVQWVVNAYLLALAMLVALGGRAGDLFGPSASSASGWRSFVGASAACGLANGEAWIIAARALQGVGAAFMIPATGAIVINAFAPRERGKAMGIYAGTSMVFLALGPLVGGLLTQGVSWRAVFFVNLPIGLVTLAGRTLTLPRARRRAPEGSIDWLGSRAAGRRARLARARADAGPDLGLDIRAVIVGLLRRRRRARAGLRLVGAALRRAARPAAAVRAAATSRSTTGSSRASSSRSSASRCSAPSGCRTRSASAPSRPASRCLPLTLPLLVAAPLAGRVYDRIGAACAADRRRAAAGRVAGLARRSPSTTSAIRG